MPNHYGDLPRTMAISGLSHVRTELFELTVIPTLTPHPLQVHRQLPGALMLAHAIFFLQRQRVKMGKAHCDLESDGEADNDDHTATFRSYLKAIFMWSAVAMMRSASHAVHCIIKFSSESVVS